MKPTGLGLKLSARRKLPVILAYDGEYWPHEFLGLLWRTWSWKRITENHEYGIYRIGDQTLKLLRTPDKSTKSPCYTREFFAHCFQDWKHQYAAPFPLKGKTVLDVGSGIGETAFLFFQGGAEKVIGVDLNARACHTFKENAETNGWNVDIINEPFSPDHLTGLHWDFCKIDVEGAESCLTGLDQMPSKPIVAEIHSVELVKIFEEKYGFKHYEILRRDHGEPAYSIMRCNY